MPPLPEPALITSFTTPLSKEFMAKKPSPLDIMNLFGKAAVAKSQKNGESAAPNDQEDPTNSEHPGAAKSPASGKSKRVATMNEHEKQQGKQLPPAPKAKGM